MKKILILFSIILMCITICSCNIEPTPLTEADLTEKDYKYIDCVYNHIDNWDNTHYDSGKHHNVGKISFFDFANSGKISFYKDYPVPGNGDSGYFINDDGMEYIEISVYDYDNKEWHDSYLVNTSAFGTDWNSSATKEEKYETIKNAYLVYLENIRKRKN